MISLTSDFGYQDEWVAAMKGVIRKLDPQVEIVDLTHQIPPFDICKGAVVLAAALPFLPVGIHVAVVDPGVGTERRGVLIQVHRGDILLGPDNGLLVHATKRLGGIENVFLLENKSLFHSPPHPTFHGRDIFAPVAAHLSRGTPPQEVGGSIDPDELVPPPWKEARTRSGALFCQVIDIDRFGNLRLSAEVERLSELPLAVGEDILVDIGERMFEGRLETTFGKVEKGKIILYPDSSGWLGLALREDNLAQKAGAKTLDAIIVYKL